MTSHSNNNENKKSKNFTFAVDFRRRGLNSQLDRDAVVAMLAACAPPEYHVNLKTPDIWIRCHVVERFTTLSVLPDAPALKGYNVRQIMDDEQKKTENENS